MSAQDVEDAGFPRVANLLRAGNVRAAWRELRRFDSVSIGEAMTKDRARRSMPPEDDEEGDE